jgi:hypothetical protein
MPRPRCPRLGSLLPRASLFTLSLSAGLGLGACGETKGIADTPDATSAPLCEPGTQACLCSTTDACDPGLLCITGRCLATQGGHDPPESAGPALRPPPGPPTPPPAASSSSDGGSDAGPADSGPDVSDASADGSPAPADAASDASP